MADPSPAIVNMSKSSRFPTSPGHQSEDAGQTSIQFNLAASSDRVAASWCAVHLHYPLDSTILPPIMNLGTVALKSVHRENAKSYQRLDQELTCPRPKQSAIPELTELHLEPPLPLLTTTSPSPSMPPTCPALETRKPSIDGKPLLRKLNHQTYLPRPSINQIQRISKHQHLWWYDSTSKRWNGSDWQIRPRDEHLEREGLRIEEAQHLEWMTRRTFALHLNS